MPRTGENIYKRKDGRWEARYIYTYSLDGKPKYRSIYGKSYAEVKQKLRITISTALIPKPTIISSPRFEEIAAQWLENMHINVKDSTYAKYRRQAKQHIIPMFGQYEIGKINTVQIEYFTKFLLEQGRLDREGGLSHKTTKDILNTTKNIFKYAQSNGHSIICNLNGIKVKREDDKDIRVLNKQEQLLFTNCLLKKSDAISIGILLSLYTGIRLGELCALRWESIDLEAKTVYIQHTLQRVENLLNEDTKTRIIMTSPKSKCSIRIIPLPAFLINILQSISSHPKAFLLTSNKNKYIEPRTIQNHFKVLLKACGIADANFHSLRHTFATRCVEIGFEVKSLSEILGHSSVNITLNKYVHSSFELKQKNMDKLSL